MFIPSKAPAKSQNVVTPRARHAPTMRLSLRFGPIRLETSMPPPNTAWGAAPMPGDQATGVSIMSRSYRQMQSPKPIPPGSHQAAATLTWQWHR